MYEESISADFYNTRTNIQGCNEELSLMKENLQFVKNESIDLFKEGANVFSESIFGSSGGNLFGNAISGAIDGAIAGAAVGPIGAAVGAIAGGVLGTATGAIENFKVQDEEFKQYVQETFETIAESRRENLVSGIDLALNDDEETSSLFKRVEEGKDNITKSMGEGYIDTVKDDMLFQDQWNNGAWGQELQEANRIVGETQALHENLKNQLERDAYESLFKSEEYISISSLYEKAKLEGDQEAMRMYGAEIGNMLSEAQVEAQNSYIESTAYGELQNANLELIESIRLNSADSYRNAGEYLSEEFSKGLMSNWVITEPTGEVNGGPNIVFGETFYEMPNKSSELNFNSKTKKKAFGMDYVPYNGYIAMLHEGERVLTARENRNYNSVNDRSVIIKENNFVIREEADIENIASQLAQKLYEADMGFYGDLGLHY